MSDHNLLESIASSLLAGGGAALTTLFGAYKDIKTRLAALEKAKGELKTSLDKTHDDLMKDLDKTREGLKAQIGSNEEPKTGLYLLISNNRELYRRLRDEIDGWETDPPGWAQRVAARAQRGSAPDLNEMQTIENRITFKLRQLETRLASLESVEPPNAKDYVSKETYTEDAEERAAELNAIRGELAAANGMLRGVLAVQGLLPNGSHEAPPRR